MERRNPRPSILLIFAALALPMMANLRQQGPIGSPRVVPTQQNEAAAAPSTLSRGTSISGWALTWSDEFNGPNGSAPDPTKWAYDTGGNGWGNHELEYYTRRRENAFVEDGHLIIRAIREDFTGPDGVTRHFTSARLKTQGIFSQAYGRFEARIQIPQGQGIWPAFWMLGEDFGKTPWPGCGEIDIMENIGREPTLIHGSMHGPGYAGSTGLTAPAQLPGEQSFYEDFHIYAIEWEPAEVRFYVDSSLYARFTPANIAPGLRWVFDHPFFILLNVAVGGVWPGPPDETSQFPQTMLVDYVRVYRKTAAQIH
jgi:beta-glucanase (GH16 family)